MQIIHSANSAYFAKEFSAAINMPIFAIESKRFPSGEYICKLHDRPNEEVLIVSSIQTNDDILELLSILHACIKAEVSEITLIAPYIAYSRQNSLIPPFSSVGIEIIARILNNFGLHKIITVDLHSYESLNLFECKVEHVSIKEILSYYNQLLENNIIVAPDYGSFLRLKELGQEMIYFNKIRHENSISMELDHIIENKNYLIIDDIVDSGTTMNLAKNTLLHKGANKITCYATHNVGNHLMIENYLTTNSIYNTNINPEQILSLIPLIINKL